MKSAENETEKEEKQDKQELEPSHSDTEQAVENNDGATVEKQIAGAEETEAAPGEPAGADEVSPPIIQLPVKLPDEGYDNSGTADTSVMQSDKCAGRRTGTASKIISIVISALFCGISLLYLAAQTVESADKLISKGIGELLLDEVFGAVTPAETDNVTSDTEAEQEDPRPNAESTVDTDTYEREDPPETELTDAASHPIDYESLANYSLLSEMSNETLYTPDLAELLGRKTGVGKCGEIYKKYGKDAPVVLIVHTHATEAYTAEGKNTYSETDSFRTQNTDENVVAVGEVITQILEAEGINVIHCTELFDAESYRESYSRSYAAVSGYIEKYPSISYVFDIHRDSVFREDKTNVASYASYDGLQCAQVMIVVGTDEGGADHPHWEDNLSFALNIQDNMVSIEESIPRKVNLRSAAFNQGLCSGSLLFEIGSCGNTLTEAKRAAVVTALAVSSAVKGEKSTVNLDKLMEMYGN